jgi:conjugative transfer pilus assembly protein TraH
MKIGHFLTLLLLLMSGHGAHADLQGALNDSLGAITGSSGGTVIGNATAPQMGESSQAGYLSGGSLYARAKIYDPNVVGFSQPYLKAGCSGIDMYGGSFSFINAEEFKNLLRSIGSNALGYAFKIGIDTMCPECGNLMADFQEKVQKLNQYLGNSCQMAQGLVTGGQKAFQASRDSDVSLANAANGVASDAWEGFTSYMSSGQTEAQQSSGSASETVVSETIEGNMVWRALNGGAAVFDSGDDELHRAIMSLTGTVIVKRADGSTEGGSATSKIVSESKTPILSLADFVEGKEITIYTCEGADSSSVAECKSLGQETVTIDSMAKMINDILIGDSSNPGLVEKLSDGTGQIDPDEEFLLASTNSWGFGVMLRRAAIAGPGFAEAFVINAGKTIGLLYAYHAAEQMIDASIFSLEPYTSLSQDAQKAQVALRERKMLLIEEYSALTKEYGGVSDLRNEFGSIVQLAHTPSPLFFVN